MKSSLDQLDHISLYRPHVLLGCGAAVVWDSKPTMDNRKTEREVLVLAVLAANPNLIRRFTRRQEKLFSVGPNRNLFCCIRHSTRKRTPTIVEIRDVYVERHGDCWQGHVDWIFSVMAPVAPTAPQSVAKIVTMFLTVSSIKSVFDQAIRAVPADDPDALVEALLEQYEESAYHMCPPIYRPLSRLVAHKVGGRASGFAPQSWERLLPRWHADHAVHPVHLLELIVVEFGKLSSNPTGQVQWLSGLVISDACLVPSMIALKNANLVVDLVDMPVENGQIAHLWPSARALRPLLL